MKQTMRWQAEALHSHSTTLHSSITDAMRTAKHHSTKTGDDYVVRNLSDGCWYIYYQNGRKVIDYWHI